MAEDIKNLIEKIHQEGVLAAEAKARDIEEQAKRQAKDILQKAKVQAEKMIIDAEERIRKMEESADNSLKQAGRDLIISLRKEIDAMLDKLIETNIRHSLSPAELAKIIHTLIKNYSGKEEAGIIIELNKEDCEKLEKGFLSQLQEKAKQTLTLRPSEEIGGGFIISYDSGKSHFDFSDGALAKYIGASLRPKLSGLFREPLKKD